MARPKYRIKSQTEIQYHHSYKPQVKYSVFSFWESIGTRVGYQTLEEVLNIIKQHKDTLKAIEKINKEGI